MQALYDVALYDVDTYDVAAATQQTASSIKAEMARIVNELISLTANPSQSSSLLVSMIESLIQDATRSQVTVVEPSGPRGNWGYIDGRYTIMDVIRSAERVLQDVRSVQHPTVEEWAAVRRDIHPAWFSFYNAAHTT